MEGAARTKVEPGKLNRYFVFGAYGSDSPHRGEITRQAVSKAGRLHGHELSHDEVCVVGDTPRDIDAARAAGVTAIGVAGGHYETTDFIEASADYILQSLTERFPGM